jgi:hypothetical protein
MHQFKSLLFLVFTAFLAHSAQATHVMGSDVFYKHLSGMKYEITLKFYRDCGGVPFANPSSSSRIRCVGGVTQSLSLSLKSIRDITPLCKSAAKPCDPANTFGTGDGMEEHVFVDTIDFAVAPFSNLLNCSNELVIETGQCCRNSDITTGPANNNFYTYAAMHFDVQNETNSTPVFQVLPVFKTMLNQPLIYALGAIDTIDYDSLSFEFGDPLSSYNTPIMFDSGFSTTKPFDAFWPSGTSFPYSNPNASPPIGIHLDAKTGVLSTTPVSPNQVPVMVIIVKEWRKDNTGTPKIISETRRDVQFSIETMPSNLVPEIEFDTTSTHQVGVAGCVLFTISDQVVIPPPPFPTPNHRDTLDVMLVGANSHLTFNIDSTVYGISSLTTKVYGKICYDSVWANNGDNTLYLYARDNHCPWNAEVSKGIFIDFSGGIASSFSTQKLIDVKVYPNPVKNELYVDLARNQENASMQLIDAAGRIVLEKQFQTKSTSINISSYDAGIYFIHIASEKGYVVKRIIIE